MIRVRATVNLVGLAAGQEANVDEANSYIAMLVEAGMLFPIGQSVAPNEQKEST